MSLGHFLDVYNGLARCSPVLHYIGKAGFFIFVMLGQREKFRQTREERGQEKGG
jgi:hypothetical protein